MTASALQTTVRLLVFAVICGPRVGLAQLALGTPSDDEAQHLERIEQQLQNGAESGDLIDPYAALGLLYEERGDYALAAAAVEQALEVVRINYGLHSIEQAPFIQQAIGIYEASGNVAGAWEREQELLALVARHPDDLKAVPVLREIADKRMDMLAGYVAGDFRPEVSLGCYYTPPNAIAKRCTAGSKRSASRAILLEAWKYYEEAAAILRNHELHASDELREIEMELLSGNYVYGELLSAPLRYELGRQRLRRLYSNDLDDSESSLERARLRVELADWDLAYSNNGAALDAYEDVYAQLERDGTAAVAIDEIFAPEIPVVLPAFRPNPLVSQETSDSTGHIDVAFEVTRYGKSRQVEILDTTANAPKAAQADLLRLISRSQFRPGVSDGEIASATPFVVRYYLR